jgi:hypothetical protein
MLFMKRLISKLSSQATSDRQGKLPETAKFLACIRREIRRLMSVIRKTVTACLSVSKQISEKYSIGKI